MDSLVDAWIVKLASGYPKICTAGVLVEENVPEK
jgi:hypothetical protein